MAENATQWEYRAATLGSWWGSPKDEALEAMLNEWGEEGWEVAGIYAGYGSRRVTVVAKRPLTRAARRQRSLPPMA